MDLRRLEMFLAVVDSGSFTKAAQRLFVSQPALSQAVRELEAELGATLFHRLPRQSVVTPAGAALVSPARQALRDVDSARAAVAAVAGLEAGRLDLCSLPTLAADPMAALTGAFRARYPKVALSLAAPDDPGELLDLVRSGAAEIGLTERPPAAPGLVLRDFGAQEFLVVLPPGAAVPPGPPSLRRLAGLDWVAPPPGTSSRRLLEDACAGSRRPLSVAVECTARDAIVPLVLAGSGAALVPRPVAESARRLGAVVLEPKPRLIRRLALVHRPGALSPAAERFLAGTGAT